MKSLQAFSFTLLLLPIMMVSQSCSRIQVKQPFNEPATTIHEGIYGSQGVHISHDPHAEAIGELEVIGQAQALAIDSKHYAQSYGVDYEEALKRMLIQADADKQISAIKAEFGNKIAGIGYVHEPEFAIQITLIGHGKAPATRTLYRQATKLKSRETVAKSYLIGTPEGIKLTQAELDRAMDMIESPTPFKVIFKVNPKARNLTKQEQANFKKNSERLIKHIPGILGMSYHSDSGELVLDVNATDAKTAGLIEANIQKQAEAIMQLPVRVNLGNYRIVE